MRKFIKEYRVLLFTLLILTGVAAYEPAIQYLNTIIPIGGNLNVQGTLSINGVDSVAQSTTAAQAVVSTNSDVNTSRYRANLEPRVSYIGLDGWYESGQGANENFVSNQLYTIRTMGYNKMAKYFLYVMDDNTFATNRDANGNLQLYSGGNAGNSFPDFVGQSGLANFIYMFHTNGVQVAFYQEARTNNLTSAYRAGSGVGTNLEGDAIYLASLGADGERLDIGTGFAPGYDPVVLWQRMDNAFRSVSTNHNPVFLFGAGSVLMNPDNRLVGSENWHYSPGGDWALTGNNAVDFTNQILPVFAASIPWWTQIQPGHFIAPQSWLNNGDPVGATNVLNLWTAIGAPIIIGQLGGISAGQFPITSNLNIYAIQQDSLVAAPFMVQSNATSWQVCRPLSQGSAVVCLINPTASAESITNVLSNEQLTAASYQVQDPWGVYVSQAVSGQFYETIPAFTAWIFKVVPSGSQLISNPILKGSVSSELGGNPLNAGLLFDSPKLEGSGATTTTRDANAYLGTLNGVPNTYWTNTAVGNMVNTLFTGGTSISYNAANIVGGMTNATFETWFQATPGSVGVLFGEGTSGALGTFQFELLYSTANLYFIAGFNGHSGIQNNAQYNSFSDDGKVHQVVGTYNGVTITLYLDGTSVATTAETGAITNNTASLSLSEAVITGGTTLAVGHSRIWTRCLSANEVALEYRQGISLTTIGATFNNVDIPTNALGTHGYSGFMTNGVFVSTGTY